MPKFYNSLKRGAVLLITLLVVSAFALGAFVSCSSDSESSGPAGTADLSLSVNTPGYSEDKGLTVISDNNISSGGAADYYWGYTAVKADSYGKTGEKTSVAQLNGTNKGVSSIKNLSVGKWKITLFAYTGTTYNDISIVYQSTATDVNIKAGAANNISIAVKRVQKAGTTGTLSVKPSEITIASTPYTAFVIDSNGTSGNIDANTMRTPFGKLSEYKYVITYSTNPNYTTGAVKLVDTTANVAKTDTKEVKKSLAAGTYYVKVEVYRTGANAGTTDKPESYVAMFPVQIYSNSTTKIQNDSSQGEYAGLDVKEVKAFKITYSQFTRGAAVGTIDPSGFTGTHQPVASDFSDENGQIIWENYPTAHQYGRSEALDEPTLEGYGFDGYWYKNGSAWTRVAYVPAWTYQDLTLYAKWDTKRYASITYDNNFPAKAVVTTGTDTTGASTSTADESEEPIMPTNPQAMGYVFKGWRVDDSHGGYTNANGLPTAWKANIAAVCKAEWEPIRYKIVVRCDTSKVNPATDFENCSAIHDQVVRLSSEWSYYDTEYSIIDPVTTKYGFIGYKRGNSNASDASNYTYEAAKMERSDGKYENLTAVNNDVVYLYALFSDYFTPLEYIRSNPVTDAPYIDSLLFAGMSADRVARVTLDMEIAGKIKNPSGEYIMGNYLDNSHQRDFEIALFSSRDGYITKIYWKGGSNNVAADQFGNIFEDERYVIDYTETESTQRVAINGEEAWSRGELTNFNSTKSITLFGTANAISSYPPNMRLYSCNMYNAAGKIVRRYQPCVLKATVPAAFSSDGAGTHTTGEIGLWDIVTNKFYPNKGTGRFYQPSEEVTITLNNVVTGDLVGRRTQKILKTSVLPGGEKLHKNLFSRANSVFLGWGSEAEATSNAYADEDVITANADVALFARWSKPVSYNLFAQVPWIENIDRYVYINTREYTKMNESFTYRIKCSLQSACRGGNTGYDYFSLYGAQTKSGVTGPYICINLTNNAIKTGGPGSTTTRLISCVSPGGKNWNGAVYPLSTSEGVDDDYWDFEQIVDATNKKITLIDHAHADRILADNDTYNPTANHNVTDFIFGAHSDQGGGARIALGDGTYLFDNNLARFYSFVKTRDGVDVYNFVPAVLTADLVADENIRIVDASGVVYDGNANEKVASKRSCPAGTVGFWDLVSDTFFCNEFNNAGNYSNFRYDTNSYTINFDGNSGLGNMDSVTFTSSTSPFRLAECRYQSPGYEFTGWNTMPDGTGVWYSDQRMLHQAEYKNMTLFAQWREVPASVPYEKIEYLQNEGLATNIGRAGIDTGVPGGKSAFRAWVKYSKTDALDSNVIGTNSPYAFHTYDNQMYVGGYYDNSFSETIGAVYEVDGQNYNDLVDGSYILNGTRTEQFTGKPRTAVAGSATWALFGHHGNTAGVTSSVVSDGGRSRVYGAKIWDENEKLVRDYIPVVLTENIPASQAWDGKKHNAGELGMWDRCENKFYTNANSTGYFSNDDLVLIQFNANGGTGEMTDQAFQVTTEKTALKANAFTKSGSKFIGWNTAADGSGVWYSDGYETNAWKGGTLYILYAQWGDTSVMTDYFEPVNYIQTGTGRAYIDTLVPGNSVKYLKMAFTPVSKVTSNWGSVLAGAVDNGTIGYASGSITSLYFRFGNQGAEVTDAVNRPTVSASQVNTIEQTGTMLKVNGASVTLTKSSDVTFATTEDTVCMGTGSTDRNGRNVNCKYYGLILKSEATGETLVNLVPCRLKKKLSTYEAGVIASDGKTHQVGEVGMWDLENNMFFANANSVGLLTCELD